MGLADFLFGKKITTNNIQPTASYGQDIDNYLNTLSTQSYMQPLLNQPKETGLTLAQYQQGVANGLNYGVPEIAKVQDELGIRKPQTEEEIELARVGSFNQPTSLNVGVANEPRQGGFFNNFSKGFNENLNNKFQASNLEPTNKNFATRFGEGFGTLARVLDSPLGRAGLVAGVVGLTGGNPLQALTYGTTTGMINQANRMKDNLYRKELEKYGFDTSGVKGYIGDDTFNKYLQSKQLQENAEWRKANLKAQQDNQILLNLYRQDQLEQQRQQNAINNYYKSQDVAQGWEKIKIDKENKSKGNSNNLNAITNQLNRFEASFQNMPNKIESNTLGRLRNVTGFQTKEEANFNSQRQLLFNKIARDLGGEKGVLSDQDIKRIEGALPSYTDSYEQKQAKMSAIYDLLNDKLSVEGLSLQPNTTTTPQLKQKSITVGKYKVRVK